MRYATTPFSRPLAINEPPTNLSFGGVSRVPTHPVPGESSDAFFPPQDSGRPAREPLARSHSLKKWRITPDLYITFHLQIGGWHEVDCWQKNNIQMLTSVEKLRALILVESTMSIIGENWLLDYTILPDDHSLTVDKSLLLILESTRVEVAVVLNELAYLKYESSKSTSSALESIIAKKMNLAVLFSLLEKIIKLLSNACDALGTTGSPLSENTSMKVIDGINETIRVVLDFLHDAKDHGQRKGDDLLASVRIVGRYLAETPFACKGKTEDLLEYILSVEGEDESSPFYAIHFMLPMLCQRTMEVDGCNSLASFGGHRVVAEYLAKLIVQNQRMSENDGTIFLACDTIINFLLNNEKVLSQVNGCDFFHLLQAMALWAGNSDDTSVVMMASSICALVFDLTYEEALLMHDGVDCSLLEQLSQLFARSLSPSIKWGSDDIKGQLDLHEIISSGFSRWVARFPSIKKTIERPSMLQC